MTFGADPRLLPDSKTVVDEFRKLAPSRGLHPVRLRFGPDPGCSVQRRQVQQGEDAANG
jgi:hypothetical protein